MQSFQKSIKGNRLHYTWFQAMHTRVDVLLYVENPDTDLLLVSEKIKFEIERLEKIANRFDSNSELSLINTKAFDSPILLSNELYQILEDCLCFHSLTKGYFDITIQSKNHFTQGISNIELNKEKQSLRFTHPDVQLDLSGYIKGYALRAVKSILINNQIQHALVNIGNSSILALGNHPYGNGWKIDFNQKGVSGVCVLDNQCLTTSGNTIHSRWPIQEPKTRKIIKNQSILSVITEDPAEGEVLSKALYLANEEEKSEILTHLKAQIIHFN
jgi:FAD:protein FMN transferase